jgi:hypothetical protein
VAEEGFTGTETSWVTDIFVPMAMKIPELLPTSTISGFERCCS